MGGFPPLPAHWNLKKPGVPRDVSVYDYICTNHGYNDGVTADRTDTVAKWLADVRKVNTCGIHGRRGEIWIGHLETRVSGYCRRQVLAALLFKGWSGWFIWIRTPLNICRSITPDQVGNYAIADAVITANQPVGVLR